MSFYPKDKTKTIQELLDYAKSFYEAEKQKLENQASNNFPHFEELESFPNKYDYKINHHLRLSDPSRDFFKSKGFWGGDLVYLDSESQVEDRYNKIKESVEKYIEDCQKIYDSNQPKIKTNQEIHKKLKDIMDAIGIPSSYREGYFKTSRSRTKTWETRNAGYLIDLGKYVKTHQPEVPKINEIFRGIDEEKRKVLVEIRNKKAQEEKIKKEAEKTQEIALLRAKYTPDNAMAEIWEIREALLEKNKYLRLAYWLEKNRGDWNDGYSYAETGLNSFSVENDTDKKIYKNISECIESGVDGVDGRVFRDTEWNYSRLYSLCDDDKLIQDLEKIKEYESDFY